MHVAAPVLLPLAWVAYFNLFWKTRRDPLDAVLKASLTWVWTALALTETLGAADTLTANALAAGWMLATLTALLLSKTFAAPDGTFPSVQPRLKPDPLVLSCLVPATLIAVVTAVLAVGLPQWNIDAQLYHLPRVEQWVQNRSLALFPTNYDLQDFFPTGAEVILLQARLLAGTEALAGLAQWCAYVVGFFAVAASVRALDGGARAQALGVLAWATLPMAVLQSSTAQSDLCGATGALLAGAFALRHDQDEGRGWDLWAAAAIGAALMLKGTNYLFMPGFGVWVALRRDWRKPQAARLALLLALATAPSLPYWCRNVNTCGRPLGSSSMHYLKHPRPASVFSNAVKSLGDELRCPFASVNATVVQAVTEIHALAGVPFQNKDWVFSTTPYDAYPTYRASWQEDYAGAPVQTLALLALLPVWALLRSGLRQRRRSYLTAWLGGGLLYLTLVRWNLWDTRLLLPFLGLGMAPLGLSLARLRQPKLAWCAVALLAGQGLWAASRDSSRPLPYLLRPYHRLEADLTPGLGPGMHAGAWGRSIGILTPVRCCPEDAICEYGIWLGALRCGRSVRIQHLIASQDTAALLVQEPWSDFRPDVIIADTMAYPAPRIHWGGRAWFRVGGDPNWSVYLPSPRPSRVPKP